MKKIYLRNLDILRKKIDKYKNISNDNIDKILKIRNNFQKNNETMRSSLCPINKLSQWKLQDGKLKHSSNQFFSIEGVVVRNAKREVKHWEQLILNQPHGGVLAFLVRETPKKGVEFLLQLRSEPGDKNVKFCPSFSATQSNMNLAHGGKQTDLYDIIIKQHGSKIIAKSTHNEEGARFWRKKNENWLVLLEDPENRKIKKKKFLWANIWQIKKLCMEDCLINPFVKTVLFMI
jgi:dTDP-4-dehydro-6-deoxy-alpha-D-glucopyranose 2,3-dehydratase